MVDEDNPVRCSGVRTAIITAIEGITPDVRSHAGDTFKHSRLDDATPRDRCFIVERVSPQAPAARALGAADPYKVNFEISVVYQATPTDAFYDRICNDADLVVDALRELATDGDIHTVDIRGASDSVDASGAHVASWTVDVTYDRRTA